MEQEKERLFWKGRSFRVTTRGPGPGQWTEIQICTTFAQGKYVAKKGGLVCLLLLGVFDRSCYVSFHKDQ